MMGYVVGLFVGVILGGASVFFAFGGPTHWRLFARLCKRKGKWKRLWAAMLVVSALVGMYDAWLFDVQSADFFAFTLLACYLLAVAVTDLRGQYIPDDATLVFAVVFLAFRALVLGVAQLPNGLIGAAVGGALLGIPHLLRRDDIGIGDVKLVATAGLMLGFPSVLYVLMRAMLFMALLGIFRLLRKKTSLRSQLPLAPFFFLSALL